MKQKEYFFKSTMVQGRLLARANEAVEEDPKFQRVHHFFFLVIAINLESYIYKKSE